MSNLYLVFALVATFSAVLLGGFAVEAVRGEKRKTLKLIESRVSSVAVNLRDETLSKSFLERVMRPVLHGIGMVARRVTPIDMRKRLARKLMLAGNPAGWDAEKVAAFKLVGLVAGGAAGWFVATMEGTAGMSVVGYPGFLAAIGYFAPDALLSGAVQRRQLTIVKALPDTLDLLTISVEAGLGFDAALAQVTKNVPGPLSLEIARMLQEIQMGVPRVEAMRKLSERTEVEDLRAFVLAMIQADMFGIGMAKVLRSQAKEMRTKRRQRAERKAMQIPVKILFPMLFCIFPALFVVIIGPGAIKIFEALVGM